MLKQLTAILQPRGQRMVEPGTLLRTVNFSEDESVVPRV